MPDYQIRITKTAQKQLDKLRDPIATDLINVILHLATNPRPPGCKNCKEEMATAYEKVILELPMISMIKF